MPFFKKGGTEGWLNYLSKNIITPPGYEIVNTNQVTVRIDFTINEEGKTEDVEVGVPFNAIYDKRALEVIKSSPQWKPALAHNVRVRSFIRQPVTFQQE
jgi:protein TonB